MFVDFEESGCLLCVDVYSVNLTTCTEVEFVLPGIFYFCLEC